MSKIYQEVVPDHEIDARETPRNHPRDGVREPEFRRDGGLEGAGTVPPTTHGFKYRLAYIVDGRRVIGFDNERGKGDHRHVDGREDSFHFSGVESLLADFLKAVAAWRRDHEQA